MDEHDPTDDGRPEGAPDEFPWLPVDQEEFTTMLLGIRNAAQGQLSQLSVAGDATVDSLRSSLNTVRDEDNKDTLADRRAWHVSEIALALLVDGYMPKREAMFDVFELVERYPLDEDELRDYQERLGL